MLYQQILELNFFLQSDQRHKCSDISDKLLEKQFTIKDVGVTHRWITHWDDVGLLPGVSEKGKWRKFNFIEYAWLKIIIECRKYNIPLKYLHDLKEILIKTIDVEENIKTPEVRQIILELTPIEKRGEVEAFLNDKNKIHKAARETPIVLCLLHLFILDIIVLKSHFAILINSDGEFVPLKESYLEKYYKIRGFNEFFQESYLSISLTEIVKRFIKGNDLELVETKLALLTKDEAEIIRIIREEELISLHIRFDQDSKIKLVELTQEQRIEKESRFLDVIMNKGYQEITVKTEKGNIVRCTNTLKKKLND